MNLLFGSVDKSRAVPRRERSYQQDGVGICDWSRSCASGRVVMRLEYVGDETARS